MSTTPNTVNPQPDEREAPFTAAEVASMNGYQHAGFFHPYTCGNNSRHQKLIAETDGWRCPDCSYTQSWAHTFTTNDAWREHSQMWSKLGEGKAIR